MELEEGMKINAAELMEQRKEEILKSGEYAKTEIIIGTDGEIPYVNLEIKGVDLRTVGRLLVCMKTTRKRILKEFPALELYEQFVDVESKTYDAVKDEMLEEE